MRQRFWRIAILAAVTLLLPAGCGDSNPASEGDAYPSRPIQLVVPFNAGGGTDAFARIVNKAIKDDALLPQPLVIVNVGGAGATIGSRRVKNARPDGHTVLILHDAILTAKISGNVPYGPEAFEPIAGTGEIGMVIVVRDDSPYQTLKELMDAARRAPGTITFGANNGALTHFAGLMLEERSTGSRFRYVQLGGGAERFSSLIGGHIEATGFSLEEFERFRSRGLRGLAVLSNEPHRLADAPDASRQLVPTARSQGYDVTMTNTFYWWVPKGTPPKRIRVLADALERAMQSEGVRRWARENQCNPIFVSGPALAERIAGSADRYGRVEVTTRTDLPNYPGMLLLAMTAVGAWMFVERVRRARSTPPPTGNATEAHTAVTRMAVSCVAATLLYFLALAWLNADFRIATFLYVVLFGGILVRFHRRKWIALLIIAGMLSFGLDYVLATVFDVHFS